MPADPADWAARRAPDVIARAEAEAVEELKRALLDAALAEKAAAPPRRSSPPTPAERPPKAKPKSAATGHALWCYCVARDGSELPADLEGVAAGEPVRPVASGGVVALASRVPLAEFGEEPLRANLNDFAWLERVARAHETVLEQALGEATIVPLRLCTIFADEDGVRGMLAESRASFDAALELLEGREEWGVKLLVDPDALEAAARARSSEAGALEEELEARTGGGAYMMRRRLERQVREVADRLAAELSDSVHARLAACAVDSVLNSPQNRELSGHEGEMLLNAAYLVEAAEVGRLRDVAGELERGHGDLGARLDVSGPWPPYNFVPREGAALA